MNGNSCGRPLSAAGKGDSMLFAGIDVGSLSAETVLIDESRKIVAYVILPTGPNSRAAAEESYSLALREAGAAEKDVRFIVATGYGRISIPFAHKKVTEISCHAAGANHLFPDTRTVIDIGGQDSKVIRVDEKGKVVDFTMNDKCAAGTGRFLEVMAASLKVPLSEMGPRSLQSRKEIAISNVCTVFAESEVVSLVAQGEPVEDILRGLHTAIVNRVWSMVKSVGTPGAVTVSGGVAKNSGVVSLIENRLGRPVHVADEPQIVGALGAALLALSQAEV